MMERLSEALHKIFPNANIRFTQDGLDASVEIHGIHAGCRLEDNGKSENVGKCSYAWIESTSLGSPLAEFASHCEDGTLETNVVGRHGFAVFPVFVR